MKTAKPVIMFGLAVILLLCFFKMPYNYYMFVRVAAFLGFTFLSVMWDRKHLLATLFAACAVLFNPIFPIHMGRVAWNIVDVSIAFALTAIAVFIYFIPLKKHHE